MVVSDSSERLRFGYFEWVSSRLSGSRAVEEVFLVESDPSMHDTEHGNHITSSATVLKGGQAKCL